MDGEDGVRETHVARWRRMQVLWFIMREDGVMAAIRWQWRRMRGEREMKQAHKRMVRECCKG